MRFPIDVILICIRWYAAYPLSYRHIEEMRLVRPTLTGSQQNMEIAMATKSEAPKAPTKTPAPPNAPSKNPGMPSGGGRGNNPPKSK